MAEERKIPEYKKKLVEKIAKLIEENKTFMIVSTKGLPSKQFQAIRKKLRDKAKIIVAKKSIILKALDKFQKGNILRLKELVDRDYAIMFSKLDPFELAGILADEKSEAAAKVGDVLDKDIEVEAGATELMPGPVISEFGALGIPVAVEDGKVAIKQNKTILKKGDKVNADAASIMLKLNIRPMEVGFQPIAAYNKEEDKTFEDIVIDKKGTLEELKTFFSKANNFALSIGYVTDETIKILINKAGNEERIISELIKPEEKKEQAEEKKKEKEEKNPEEEEKKENAQENKSEENKQGE